MIYNNIQCRSRTLVVGDLGVETPKMLLATPFRLLQMQETPFLKKFVAFLIDF